MRLTFSMALLKWFDKNARNLPWRETKDPYLIWISEVMLQQTTVNAVIPYFEKWKSKYPTVQDLADASIQEVLTQWQGLGYYARARNLHRCAKEIVTVHSGKIPADPQVVRKLPGFGPYTTGAVLSIAYGLKIPIIDANVRRVIMRILAIEGEAVTKNDAVIMEFLNKNLPDRNIGDFNQALMELGALICRSKEPFCGQCPVSRFCKAYEKGIQEIIPKPKKSVIKNINAVIAIIENKGRYFIQKRPSKGLLADMWEFPGGKVEAGELPEDALKRELNEELGIKAGSAKYMFDIQHFYTQFRVNLSVWAFVPEFLPESDNTHKWIASIDFLKYPMPSGSAKIVDKLFSKKNT